MQTQQRKKTSFDLRVSCPLVGFTSGPELAYIKRLMYDKQCAAIAPAVERTLGKGEVACSNHASSTTFLHHLIQPIELLHFICLHGD